MAVLLGLLNSKFLFYVHVFNVYVCILMVIKNSFIGIY